MREIKYGATGISTNLYLTNIFGLPITGLSASSVGLAAYYAREKSAPVSVGLVATSITNPYSAGGFVEIGTGTMNGVYRLDIPDNAFAAGANFVNILLTGANIVSPPFEIPMTSYDPSNITNDGYNLLDAPSGVETNYTLRQALRLILSSSAAKLTGATSGPTIFIRDINDTKDRITATIDASGNRTAISYNVS